MNHIKILKLEHIKDKWWRIKDANRTYLLIKRKTNDKKQMDYACKPI